MINGSGHTIKSIIDGAPPDGKPEQITNTFNKGLVVTFDLLATFGIIFVILCLVFNFTFRNKK